MSFFLGVGADLDEERHWKVFIAKLKTALETVLNHRDDVTDQVWTREGEGSG